jgi:hypothetical protein
MVSVEERIKPPYPCITEFASRRDSKKPPVNGFFAAAAALLTMW